MRDGVCVMKPYPVGICGLDIAVELAAECGVSVDVAPLREALRRRGQPTTLLAPYTAAGPAWPQVMAILQAATKEVGWCWRVVGDRISFEVNGAQD
jgi:hypothetical protein